jgi:hypothetical protein
MNPNSGIGVSETTEKVETGRFRDRLPPTLSGVALRIFSVPFFRSFRGFRCPGFFFGAGLFGRR